MAEVLDFVVNLSMVTGGNFNTAIGPAAQKLAALSAKMQKLNNTSRNISGFQKQSQKLTELRAKLDAARTKVRDMQTIMRSGGTVDARLFTKANEEAAKLQQQVAENSKRLGEFRAELQGAGIDTSDLAGAQQRLQSQTEAMTRAQERLTRAQSRYAEIQGQLSWGNIKGDVIKSAAIVKTFQVPIKVDMEFEQAMAQTKSVALPSPEEFAALEAQAKKLGRETQFSATQAANSQEVLMRAGLNTQQVLEQLPNVLSVAAAEGLEIAQAADLLVNATGGMKLDTSMMGIVGDILAYTSSHSNTNIPQLAEAMQIAAPAASDIGMPIEQLASLLGAMSTTVRGSQAGTAIASTISRLAKAPKQVTDALKELGIARFTKDGNFVEIPVLIQQIEDKLSTMGKGVAESYRSKIYGQFAPQMSGLYAGIANGTQAKLELGAYTERDGAALNMSLIRNDTLNGDLTALSSAWEGLMIKIGEALTPINRYVVQTLTTGIQKVTAFLEKNKLIADIVTRIAYAYGGWRILSTIGKYTGLVWNLGRSWLEVAGATKAAEVAAGAIPPKVGLISSAFTWLKGIIMAHPIIALGTLVAGVVYLVIKHWDTLKAWWKDFVIPNVWEPLKTHTIEAIDYIKGLWDGFKQWIVDKFANLNPFNWEMPAWLKSMGGSSANQVSNAQAALGGSLPPSIPQHATGGIMTRPHIGMVAEAGPEAIIPLTDKSRGIPLVMQAAQALGLNTQTLNTSTTTAAESSSTSTSIVDIMSDIFSSRQQASSSATNNTLNMPPVNLTVNVEAQEGQSGESIAMNIADKVRDVLAEIMSLEERVSYA